MKGSVSSSSYNTCLIAKSCGTFGDPMVCSPLGSSVRGIPQARILEWVATLSSRGSSQPREGTQVSRITGGFHRLSHQGSPELRETVRM